MLDRILNINTNEKYKSGTKVSAAQSYTVNRHDQEKHNTKDSALFSPLAKLLAKINWTILNIDYPSNDEISLHFLVDDLEFKTVIHYSQMYTEAHQEFLVSKSKIIQNKNIIHEVSFKVEKEDVSLIKTPEPIQVDNLQSMFEKLSDLNIRKDYKIIDRPILNSFVSGSEYGLKDELNYILEVIYTFISTRHKNRVKNNFILKSSQNIPIIMQKVAIIYAE